MTTTYTKIKTGTYRVRQDGQMVGTVARREDSSRTGCLWVATRHGFLQGVHATRTDAAASLTR